MPADLLVFAPRSGGHFAEFTRWIVSAGVARGHRLALAASPDLLSGAPDLADLGADVVAVGAAGAGRLKPSARETRAMLTRAAAHAPAHRTLHTYLDDALVALALAPRSALPPGLAGLLFRAPFRVADPFASPVRLGVRREVLRHLARGRVETMLTLDAAVVPELERLGARAAWLPDPVEPVVATASRDAVRAEYGIQDGRALAILFGSLEERKGLSALDDAIHRLPAEAARRLAVVIVGQTYDEIRPRLTASVSRANAETEVQVVFREAFLSDAALADLTASADVVLAPYLGHVGSSGVVVRAAAAGVPVIGQQAAQMGREIRAHGLGLTVEPSDPEALASALRRILDGQDAFDADGARAYVAARRLGRFEDALYAALMTE